MPSPLSEIDLVAYDSRGQAVLLAEVKNRRDTSDLWAAKFRRNRLAHGTLPPAPYFLIATPDRMYFWRQGGPGQEEEPPHFTMDATVELKPYFEKSGLTPGATGGEALDLIVFSWLNDISESGLRRSKQDSSLRWLADSGLLEALQRSRIELGAVQ
jgi:hypothetical protein